jgi:hypothetical protein
VTSPGDPYATLGLSPSVTDAELRSAYRRLVQLHHPDHNGGSAESARRFEEVQDAYARVRALRAGGGARATRTAGSGAGATNTPGAGRTAGAGRDSSSRGGDPIEDRLRAMEQELRESREAREREVREARAARERAAAAARAAANAASAATTGDDDGPRRTTDEDLGIYKTDDSFGKILSDVRDDVTELFGKAISAAERAAEDAARRAADHRGDRDRDRD